MCQQRKMLVRCGYLKNASYRAVLTSTEMTFGKGYPICLKIERGCLSWFTLNVTNTTKREHVTYMAGSIRMRGNIENYVVSTSHCCQQYLSEPTLAKVKWGLSERSNSESGHFLD